MKTVTIALSEAEYQAVCDLASALDPSGSIKPTSVAKGCLLEGLVRSAKRVDSALPLDWLTTDAVKRYIGAIRG